MLGFQEVAAAIGIAELALRGISRVYDFVHSVKNAPETILRLHAELEEVDQCLLSLKFLDVTDSPIGGVLKSLALATTINRCGELCWKLDFDLCKWTHTGHEALVSRIRVWLNRNRIERAIDAISVAKENINLGVSIRSLQVLPNAFVEPSTDDDQTFTDQLRFDNVHGGKTRCRGNE